MLLILVIGSPRCPSSLSVTSATINETGFYDRSLIGAVKRKLRGPWVPPDVAELHHAGTNWKREWYARGEAVTVDATPFL
jgi:hypothetical protein